MVIFVKICSFGIYSFAVYLFSFYLSFWYIASTWNDWLLSDEVAKVNQLYDFIVVGAGSAGATIAAELRNEGHKVLVVEAGALPAPFFNIPVLAPLLQQSPYDWQYKTVSQDNACKGLLNNQSLWPAGKVLGGSSRLNYMAYVPGHPKDYNRWFFDYADHKFEETDPRVNEPTWSSYLSDVLVNAIQEVSTNKTINDFSRVKLTMQNGERWSTDRLLQDKFNDSLHVITNGYVNKLLFDGDTVKGIEYTKWQSKFKAFAHNGVILSAGAIGSPKLLMLSGIGPKKHLESLQITVIKNLPVGDNLVDHILTGIDLITLNETSPLSIEELLNPISAWKYFVSREGPWTSAGIEAQGTFYTSSQIVETEAPALQLMVIPVGVSQDSGVLLRKSMGISDEIFHEYFAPLMYRTAITIAPVLLHPKSSGHVMLKSSNPLEDPIIDPKYLSNKDDVSTLISGIQLVKRFVNTVAMKKLGASLYKKKFPGCENYIFDSTDYWECYIRHLTLTSYHPAGTCRIGDVVDKNFRVFGTRNLYVVDASVLPELPSGNINAAVMMVARKAAKILNSHAKRTEVLKRWNKCDKITGYFVALYGLKQSSLNNKIFPF